MMKVVIPDHARRPLPSPPRKQGGGVFPGLSRVVTPPPQAGGNSRPEAIAMRAQYPGGCLQATGRISARQVAASANDWPRERKA